MEIAVILAYNPKNASMRIQDNSADVNLYAPLQRRACAYPELLQSVLA